MNLTSMTQLLEKFGPWGVCAILLAGIIYLYRSTSQLLERRNEQFISALKEMTAALQTNADESRRVEMVLGRVERILDRRNE
jgi:hypothetical protein